MIETIERFRSLTELHRSRCDLYRKYVDTIFDTPSIEDISDIPFLPARFFKNFQLKSVEDGEIYKVLKSSGTNGRQSQIYLDRRTASAQTRTLVGTIKDRFGASRFPMLIIDSADTITRRDNFSARTAAINGFSMFAKGKCFALDSDGSLNIERVNSFIHEYQDRRIFIFGFTYIVWRDLIKKLYELDCRLNLNNSFLLHGGGWKKLLNESVDDENFKRGIFDRLGCQEVCNYYGMVEQTGTIFIECERGKLHASAEGHAIVRDPISHGVMGHGELGLIQVFSGIQESYPGHSILTDDLGRSFPASSCLCGREGAVISISGRLPSSEVRGCSDTHNR